MGESFLKYEEKSVLKLNWDFQFCFYSVECENRFERDLDPHKSPILENKFRKFRWRSDGSHDETLIRLKIGMDSSDKVLVEPSRWWMLVSVCSFSNSKGCSEDALWLRLHHANCLNLAFETRERILRSFQIQNQVHLFLKIIEFKLKTHAAVSLVEVRRCAALVKPTSQSFKCIRTRFVRVPDWRLASAGSSKDF